MSRRARGFKISELIVVVAIIAILIVFLLPSVSSIRQNDRAVRCTANLKQLYMATTAYSADNDNWMLPANLNNGDTANARWYGPTALGPMFATFGPTSGIVWTESYIKKLLDCPEVNHPSGWGPTAEGGNGKWGFDYTYNQTMGSNSAAPGAPYDLRYPFVKHTQVRPEVLLFTEVRDVSNVHDYVFDGVTPSLVPTSSTNFADFQSIAATPHQGGKRGNMVFNNGAIVLDNINKLLGPPPKDWMVVWDIPKTESSPFQ